MQIVDKIFFDPITKAAKFFSKTGAASGQVFVPVICTGYANANLTGTAHGASAQIRMDTREYDPLGLLNTSNWRITPNAAGLYFVQAQVVTSSTAADSIQNGTITIHKNGAAQKVGDGGACNANPAGQMRMGVSAILQMNGSTDYFSFNAYGETNLGATTWTMYGGIDTTYFNIFRIG